jgi:predicted phosphodiesterase
VLVAHHPLLLTPAAAHRGQIGGGALALQRLARAGIDLALGGHLHLGYAGIANGILVVQAGSGVSSRLVGERNGFNLIEGDRKTLRVEHWRWQGEDFSPHASHHFQRTETGWRASPA